MLELFKYLRHSVGRPVDQPERTHSSQLAVLENFGLFLFFSCAIIHDLFVLGIGGDSNTRWLSFLDSLSHCSAWAIDDASLDVRERIIGTFLSKYGSGLIISLILGVTPGFLQTNTTLSFALALAFAQSSDRLASLIRSRHGLWRTLFVISGSLHKSRKLKFAVSKAYSFYSALGIGILAVELTGWLVVLIRGILHREDALAGLKTFIYRYRLRYFFTFYAICLTYWEVDPLLPLAALVLHKAISLNDSGDIKFDLI